VDAYFRVERDNFPSLELLTVSPSNCFLGFPRLHSLLFYGTREHTDKGEQSCQNRRNVLAVLLPRRT